MSTGKFHQKKQRAQQCKGMSCPSWQWHRTGYLWPPVRNLLVAPLWCDLGHCSLTVVVIKLQRTSAFKDSQVSLLTGLWPHKMAYWLQRISTPCGIWTHVSLDTLTWLTTEPQICFDELKKKGKWIVNTWKLEPLAMSVWSILILDCSSQILRSDKIHWNSWQQNFDQQITSHWTYIG